MDDDKITDDEIDALDGVDLLELGQKFLDNGDGQRALKCFLRAGEPDKSVFSRLMGLSIAAEIYRNGLGGVPVDAHKAIELYKKIGGYRSDLCIAEIYANGCGEITADGYKALKFYRQVLRYADDGTVSLENNCCKILGDKPVNEWHYPSEEYLKALRGQADIFRYGKGGVPVDGRKALNYYKRIVKTIFGTLDIDSLDEDEKFKRILADGQNGNFAFEALGEIETMYGYGEASVRYNFNKFKKFYNMAFYVGHGYLDDENYRSWRRKNDERTTD